jgi:hypothetical protein
MSDLAFFLIVFSAFMHALWNLLVKSSVDKTVFIWWMFVSSGLLLNVTLLFLPGSPFPVPDLRILLLGRCRWRLFHALSPLQRPRLPRWRYVFDLSAGTDLHALRAGLGVCCFSANVSLPFGLLGGILLIAAGAYSIQLRRLDPERGAAPLSQSRRATGASAALSAGFIYSVGAVIDKIGVMTLSSLSFHLSAGHVHAGVHDRQPAAPALQGAYLRLSGGAAAI